MWDWFDHEEEKEEATFVADFTPITRSVDPTALKGPDADGEAWTDLFDGEEKLFQKSKKKYQANKEMELGFPDDKQEFVAKKCLKDVLDEYSSYTKARGLKPIKKGMGLILHGDENFRIFIY